MIHTTLFAAAPLDARFVVHVTPEMLRHSFINNVLYFTGAFWSMAALLIVLRTRLSARIARLSSRIGHWPFIRSMVFFALLSLVLAAFEFPLAFYGGFVVPHEFALTHQTLASWFGDWGKALAVDIALSAPVAALAMLGIRLFRRWWVVLWLGTIPVTLFGIVLIPLVVDPLFNQFVPLKDPALRQSLLAEASRAGIEGARVYQVDKSKQTTTMNAYVTGLGPSKRIVLWDTLLAKMNRDEIVSVMGHEMGHYVLDHIWKGFFFAIAVSLLICLLLQPLIEWMLQRFGASWAVTDARDDAVLPATLLVVAVLTFVLSPVINGFSRRIEHQADVFGLDLTHLNEAAATSMVKFSEDSKSDPNPNAFIEWWRYSHPSAAKRIAFALNYRPRSSPLR